MNRPPLRGVVVSHGPLARALVAAVQRIAGEDGELLAISNDGCTGESLIENISAAVNGMEAVVFVDLPMGSCQQAAVRHMKGRDNVAVVSGVNLAMLLDFIYHRDLTAEEAASRASTKGVDAIKTQVT